MKKGEKIWPHFMCYFVFSMYALCIYRIILLPQCAGERVYSDFGMLMVNVEIIVIYWIVSVFVSLLLPDEIMDSDYIVFHEYNSFFSICVIVFFLIKKNESEYEIDFLETVTRYNAVYFSLLIGGVFPLDLPLKLKVNKWLRSFIIPIQVFYHAKRSCIQERGRLLLDEIIYWLKSPIQRLVGFLFRPHSIFVLLTIIIDYVMVFHLQ